MPNRLAHETSPYLLQHQNNPVDWYPWGDEAFAKAVSEDKPIFLSIGYSSCHWCHVMEHESFEDAEVAALLNDHFVSIKVDREERPDVDEAYMTAVQLSSGRGGWPMSVFMTPDKNPFFAGTYLPKDNRGEHPGFLTILGQLIKAWGERRQEIQEAGEAFAQALREALLPEAPASESRFDEAFFANAVRELAEAFDPEEGGFGSAPKFPPHSAIDFLLTYALTPGGPVEIQEAALGMALHTLEKMALGGIHDHVGGGFHRYSTDARWHLPHFEKMLYDNALMISNYGRAAAIAREVDPELVELYSSALIGTAGWLEREMTAPSGIFYSALDADSEGVEGKSYVWTVEEVNATLGLDSVEFLEAFGFEVGGNFADEATGEQSGANVLHLSEPKGSRFSVELTKLLAAREKRVAPGLDNKSLVSWNGLAISGLAEAGFLPLAEKAARTILSVESLHGELPHQIVGDRVSGAAYLEDYAYFIAGLIRLAAFRQMVEQHRDSLPPNAYDDSATTETWLEPARRLTMEMIDLFYDPVGHGFFSTSVRHENLFGRTKPVFDQPIPSANAVAIRCLLDLGLVEGATESLQAFKGWMERAPQATESLYSAALMLPREAPTVPVSAPVTPPKVRVSLEASELKAEGGVARGVVILDIPDGYHINSSNPPARWLVPTELKLQPLKATFEFPEAIDDQYRGRVLVPFTVALPSGQKDAEFEITASFQACTESECLLAEERKVAGVVFA